MEFLKGALKIAVGVMIANAIINKLPAQAQSIFKA